MAIRVRGFSSGDERALARALTVIQQRLRRPPCAIPQDLRSALQDILSGSRPRVTLAYGGAKGACREIHGRTAGYRVQLCKKTFQSPRRKASSLSAVLFHEFVHVARGGELDSEAFENAFFSKEGARPPTPEDWADFKEDGYQGWWVRLDPRTRRVTDYADRLIVTFPPRKARRSR